MDQKDFLARVLPSGNHYIAYPSDRKDSRGKPIWNHRSFTEPSAGVNLADWTASRNKDVYFTVASYKQASVWDEKLGKEKSYRKQENVAELKSLFLDIDFKNYDSPEQTVNALENFLSASQLERPSIVVLTGGGIHVYWTLPHPISLEEWQPLANGLAGIAENLGLRADLQCTIDSARILRMPGTRNFKYDPPLFCEVVVSRVDDVDLEKLAQRLRGVTSIRARTGRVTPGKPLAFTVDPAVASMFPDSGKDLGGYDDSSMAQMAQAGGCPMIADMLARGGNGDSRDLWNNMLLLAAYTTDGPAMVHMLSSGDPRYTQAETDAEFQMKLADQAKLGPTTCDTFARLSLHCATCPHRGKIKSPIVLGRAPSTVVTLVPEPTFVRGFITYARNIQLKDGTFDDVPIFDMAMDRPVLINIPGEARLETTFRRLDRVETVSLECSKFQSRDYLPSKLGGHTIHYSRSMQPIVERVFMAWTALLRNESTIVNAPAFGWSELGFSLNGNLYTPGGDVRRVGVAQENVTPGYGAKGDVAVWQNLAAAVIADPRTELQLLLATAFAAPLIEFTELASTAVVLRSPNSGVGKTSVMKLACSVYGDPTDMHQATDTPMAVEMKLASLTNMPWYWDEVKVPDDKKMSDTIYQILQGKSKGRARPDGGLRGVHKTNGMLVMATNLSVREIMQEAGKGTDAGSLRVFEMELPARSNRTADPVFSSLVGKLNHNHGHIGQVYAAYLAANRTLAEETVHWTATAFTVQEQERYWATSARVMLAGAMLATQAGICSFDVKRMLTHLKSLLTASRSTSSTTNAPEELAGRIWRYYSNQSLITDTFPVGGPGVPKPVTWENPPTSTPHGPPRVRLAYITDQLFIAVDGIRDYARAIRQQPELLCQSIARISKQDRTSIDKGVSRTGSKVGREQIYIMKASDVLGADEVQQWVTSAATRRGATPGSSSGSAPSGSTVP